MQRYLFLLLLLSAISCSLGASVIEYTDENFEHLTQVSTGSTSGAHFVLFYAPWCGHCQQFHPVWDEVNEILLSQPEKNVHGIVLGKIDITANPRTANRFDVTSIPTIILFKDGKMMQYNGKRTKDDVLTFALGHFLSRVNDFQVAPKARSAWLDFDALVKDLDDAVSKEKYGLLGMVFFTGLSFGVVLSQMITYFLTGKSPFGQEAAKPKEE